MKRKKIKPAAILASLAALALAALLPLSAAAEDAPAEFIEESEVTESIDTPDQDTDIPAAEGGAEGAVADQETDPEAENADTDQETEAEAENAAGFLKKMGGEIKNYLGEIFSALALVGSIILAIAYKRGLLPAVTSSLSATYGAVKSIKESTDKTGRDSIAAGESICARLSGAEEVISTLASRIEELNASLAAREESATEREKTRIIILAQVDMLYEVFMSSSLPQYEKDAIAERVKAMRSALEVGENE